jgi:hypothetical protein
MKMGIKKQKRFDKLIHAKGLEFTPTNATYLTNSKKAGAYLSCS